MDNKTTIKILQYGDFMLPPILYLRNADIIELHRKFWLEDNKISTSKRTVPNLFSYSILQ